MTCIVCHGCGGMFSLDDAHDFELCILVGGKKQMQFDNVSQRLFDALAAEMVRGGVQIYSYPIAADLIQSGTIEGHGITCRWRYDPGAQSLTLDVQHKPFFVGLATIEERLNNELDALRGRINTQQKNEQAPASA